MIEFNLFQIVQYHKQWWVAIWAIDVGSIYTALLHIERDHGQWKIDVLWLRTIYYWLKNRE